MTDKMSGSENPRQLRGLSILANGGDAVVKVRELLYSVKSQRGNDRYAVEHNGTNWFCECPDFKGRNVNCKHIFAVLFSRKLHLEAREDTERETPALPEGPLASTCPKCAGETVVRSGQRKTKGGEVQRFECRACGHRFTVDKGFSRMKTDPKAVTVAMDLYFKGVSIRKIQDHLKQFHGLKVSTATPLRWIRKYLAVLSTYADRHQAQVCQFWHSDEMMVKVRAEGNENNLVWLWNLMDHETRYLLACRVTKARFAEDARKPIQDAKARTGGARPKAFITDGLQGYIEASRKEFFENDASPRNPHIRAPPMSKDPERAHPTNNILERLNGTVRERLKVMRGLDSPETAQDTLEGFRTYYNLLRPHMGLEGGIPALAAGIPVPTEGNRWMALIGVAAAKNGPSPAMKQGVEKGPKLP